MITNYNEVSFLNAYSDDFGIKEVQKQALHTYLCTPQNQDYEYLGSYRSLCKNAKSTYITWEDFTRHVSCVYMDDFYTTFATI